MRGASPDDPSIRNRARAASLCDLLPKWMDDRTVRFRCDPRHKSYRFRRSAVQDARRKAGETGHQLDGVI